MTNIETLKLEMHIALTDVTATDIRKCIDYLHSRGYLGGVWQPIETAPKDGGGFIGYQKISDEQYVISACAFYGEFVWINWGEGLNTSANPTHWMPLPKPPEETK